jgi:large subunit ribosomal protein L21
MYAIVNIAGQQFKVTENRPVYVHRLSGKEGDSVKFDQVLMVGGNGGLKVGAPVLSGATVTGKIMGHVKGDKVLVFKKKRRKGYQKLNGHRQQFTKIQVDKISI